MNLYDDVAIQVKTQAEKYEQQIDDLKKEIRDTYRNGHGWTGVGSNIVRVSSEDKVKKLNEKLKKLENETAWIRKINREYIR